MSMLKKWWLRNVTTFYILGGLVTFYIMYLNNYMQKDLYLEIAMRQQIIESIQKKMEEAVQRDRGTGCEIPKLDPFAKEATRFDVKLRPLKCPATRDWVKCYHSQCTVIEEGNVNCKFWDLLYKGDFKNTLGRLRYIPGGGVYHLAASDHVKVSCFKHERNNTNGTIAKWDSHVIGFHPVRSPPSPPGRENTYNVLIFAFDSTSRTGFIRQMPKSWKVLNTELNATIMEGYNIVGDGTSAALFPILTGNTELDLPDVRKRKGNNRTLDELPFIFKKLKRDGYRTAYFEDMPVWGTFQWRYNGFRYPPADHYNRAFMREVENKKNKYCLGDTPQFRVMMNITQQFMELDGKKFIFTIVADITHNDFNLIQWADNDMVEFLRRLLKYTEDTLIVIMGDHGPKYSKVRNANSIRGKLDERLPLVAIRLPSRLVRSRPDALSALKANAHTLTTPHDLHATILDALDMRQHWNPYKLPGTDLKRGLTMLEPIPRNRSCSEAGIEPHWCTCLVWQPVDKSDPLYQKSGIALVNYINSLLKEAGSKCVPRTLKSVEWVLRQRVSKRLLTYAKSDYASYVGHFTLNTSMTSENYQLKIVANPGRSTYEASLTYKVLTNKFLIHRTDISRTNEYKGESDCVIEDLPHLAAFCYCRR